MFKVLSDLLRKASAKPDSDSSSKDETPLEKQFQEAVTAVEEVATAALDTLSEAFQETIAPEPEPEKPAATAENSDQADPQPGPSAAEGASDPRVPVTDQPSTIESAAQPTPTIEDLAYQIYLERSAKGESGDEASDWEEAEKRLAEIS